MQKLALVVALLALPSVALVVSACEDSSDASSGGISLDAGAVTLDAASSTTEDATATNVAAAPGIYVTNANTNSITVYALGATGNAAPLRSIVGASTGLSLPIGIVVDSQSHLYAANRSAGTVTVYDALATGDAAPIRTLTATGMGAPEGLGLGTGDELFVSACPGCGGGSGDIGVFHFPSNATASDYSIAGTNTTFTNPSSVVRTATGELVVGNSFNGNVATFAAGATGNAAPTRTFSPANGGNEQGLDVAQGAIFLTNPGDGIEVFPATATGSTAPSATIGAASLPLGYPGRIFVDASSTPPVIYLADATKNAVYVIQTSGTAPNLAAATVTTISGAATLLDGPLGIVVVK